MKLSILCAVAGLGLWGCETGTSRSASKKPVATALPPSSGQSAGLSDEEVKSQVGAYLGSIDTPISRESWRALGPRGAAQLIAVLDDGRMLPTRRARAVDGLAMMGWSDAAPTVLAVASNETENVAVRFAAIRALSALMPETADAPLTLLMKTSKEARVRAVAAEMLSERVGGCAVINTQLATETDEARAFFGRAQKQCMAN